MKNILQHLKGEPQEVELKELQPERTNVFSDASKSHAGICVGKKTFSMKLKTASTSATVMELQAILQGLEKLERATLRMVWR